MNRWAGRCGASLISWAQTEIDGVRNASETCLDEGSYWRWSGDAVDLDAAEAFLPEGAFASPDAHRLHTARLACRVISRAVGRDLLGVDEDRMFTLSDGRREWSASIVDLFSGHGPLLIFVGEAPPRLRPLKVVRAALPHGSTERERASGVVCFTPGTVIDTPEGWCAVEDLAAGDVVVTADDGPQDILWIGARHIGARAMVRTPELAPIRIGTGALGTPDEGRDLLVSPDHRMLVRGRGNVSEVLVAARDLVGQDGVRREPMAGGVTYIHLMLERHHVLFANGFETESFHPGAACLDEIPVAERLRLFDIMPGLERTPDLYGARARPYVSGAEAALIAAA